MPLWVHAQRYVHRDIKPANVLVRRTGEVVVIDLGIVRETGAPGLTQTGYIAPHTPGYAAPEQLAADKALICFKADFFAIGVVMYQLMSGVRALPYPAVHRRQHDHHLASHQPDAGSRTSLRKWRHGCVVSLATSPRLPACSIKRTFGYRELAC